MRVNAKQYWSVIPPILVVPILRVRRMAGPMASIWSLPFSHTMELSAKTKVSSSWHTIIADYTAMRCL